MDLRRSLPCWALALLVAGSIVAGCGDDSSGSSTTADESASSEPARFVRRMLDTTAHALSKKDCREVAAINRRSPTKTICPPPLDSIRTDLEQTKLLAAATYGTAAIVEYRQKKDDPASIVLFRAPSGEWGVAAYGIVAAAGGVGSDGEDSQADARGAVEQYLAAVRERDCETYEKVAVTQLADPRQMCREEFPLTRPLSRELEASPTAEPRYLGGNESFGFFGLTLTGSKPAYYTITAVRTPEGSLRPFVVLGAQRGPNPG